MNGLEAALDELGTVARAVDPVQIEASARAIAGAGTVMVYGCGREGLMLRALAMRLAHLGLSVSVQGDMAAPPLGRGDLFLCSAGPGDLATVTALMGVAQGAGAKVLMLTAEPEAEAPCCADQLLVIPAQTMARDMGGGSVLPMGSLYEGALFLLGEMLVLRLAEMLGQGPDALRARHTNME